MSIKRLGSILPGIICLSLFCAKNVNFISKPLTAGKASPTGNGDIVFRTIGTANFSPDLRLPIQLIYNSAREKTGIFGFAMNKHCDNSLSMELLLYSAFCSLSEPELRGVKEKITVQQRVFLCKIISKHLDERLTQSIVSSNVDSREPLSNHF